MKNKINDDPDFSKIDIGKVYDFLKSGGSEKHLQLANKPKYLFWNKVKYLTPPGRLTPEEFWKAILLARSISLTKIELPSTAMNNKLFHFHLLPRYQSFLNQLDSFKAEKTLIRDLSEADKRDIIRTGLIEESIASSQIEGANTTRKVAKQMLLEGRKPANTSEQMIFNNYRTISHIEATAGEEKLSFDVLFGLHELLTNKTMPPDEIGRLREDNETIVVANAIDETIYHIPPSNKFVKEELKKLFKFANEKTDLIHPVIKAIIIHFWIGYLHPFVDGNGRMGRALFYWSLMKNGYNYFSFLPLSTVIKKAQAQYRDAYLLSETKENDLTYFIEFNLLKIDQAIKEFEIYKKKQETALKQIYLISQKGIDLNQRQLKLLTQLRKQSNYSITITSYTDNYNVSRMTATKDLKQLLEQGFVVSKKVGKYVYYFATDKVAELFDN